MTSPVPDEGIATHARIVLVVDDDEAMVSLLERGLQRSGYEVWGAFSAQQALDVIRRRGLPHLALVDIMMPEKSGLDFCDAVHAFSDLPIIMLTAVINRETVIEAIERCAEDYVTKPFDFRELTARMERVLRRIGDFSYAAQPIIEVDDRLSVDLAEREAIVDGESVELTPTETRLLHILMRNTERVTPTDLLVRRLWPLRDNAEDTLRVHVHRLRSKIEPDPTDPSYIITERGRGYQFLPGGDIPT
jgi:DNA-binding response OmpR family regulator